MPDTRRPVLGVEEARERILATVDVLEAERVPVLEASGRVLAEEIAADRDIPPLTNAAMDGYAVRGADVVPAPARLRVLGEVAAGRVSDVRVGPGTAVRIMTGAPIPDGADTVVRFEDTQADGEEVEVLASYSTGKNVRPAGEDVRAGQVVLRAGHVLRPQEIGMLAAVGRTDVTVVRRPRVAILATGDEVVPPDRAPRPGQIRDANSYTVAAQVQSFGGAPLLLGVARDQATSIRAGMRAALDQEADLVITSGGVSVGDFDLVKQVLAAEGEMHFWALNMKPGRPLAFGVLGGVPLLGLPGNPVAAMVSTLLFVRPALLKMQGFTEWSLPTVRARLAQPIERKDGRRHYLRVRLRTTETGREAILTGDQGSGILKSLVDADGLAIIPEDVDHLAAGTAVEVICLPSAPRGITD
ncbi:MAG TPA: molybdopterin molybdenumtransferase MoeA [Chloroflexi bacterium]|nr:molybdopterin molybdenumtransferase MoeA [Chloroflexota bacterium]